jgi:hypothetical protein
MVEFRSLLKKKVSRLFLVVWTPWGEEKESDIDISFGFVFKDEPNRLCVISVDKNELWSPHLFYEPLPKNEYTWEDFYSRMKQWMEAAEDTELVMGFEYYDVTKCELFKKIINSEIIRIELISIEDNAEPFGVKIHFNNDYIISTPISDGNTVETSRFNQNNNVEAFKRIGTVIYKHVT